MVRSHSFFVRRRIGASPNQNLTVSVRYGAISMALPIIYLSEYAYYEKHGKKSPWPYQITMILDYGWFFCLAVTAKFIPSNMVARRSFELLHLSESCDVLRVALAWSKTNAGT
mmetsp:Transcript_11554/g.32003  ORF Transcript_11554/g.32003 Transcript_11554/m.32003 type:complete len:113 (+) Transcript_11554:314-652(+)